MTSTYLLISNKNKKNFQIKQNGRFTNENAGSF